jgi:hypothetical protein
MNELEEYLLNNNTVIYEYFADNYEQFNYDSYEELKLDLDFLLSNIYSDINIINFHTKDHSFRVNYFCIN